METSAVILVHAVRFLQIHMDVAHFLMECAARIVGPVVPKHTCVSQRDCVNQYVLSIL